ncbi:PAS domain S-box protein [Methanoregula sp.]|uniref:PAS domain S-box protein n=1 Tax=Methanoregula sp. TaxID=2052170 RepID=UPI003565486F
MSPDEPREEPGGAGLPETQDPNPALPLSVEQLTAILQASPIPMFVIDKHHRVISWNLALEQLTGIAARQILGTTEHWKVFYTEKRPCLADIIVDGAYEKIKELYAEKSRKSETTAGVYEATDFFPRMGSAGKWVHSIAAPVIDNTGVLVGAVEKVEDITRIIGAQKDLRESEERYSALFSNNYSVSLLIDPDTGQIVEANDAAVRYYGYPHDRLLSLGIYDLNRLPREKVVQNLVRAKDENAKHFPSVHYRSDGEKRYVEIYSGPIRVQGKPLFYSIIHDITDSRLATRALKESEERYRTLIDQLPDYIIVHRNGILLFVNPAGAANLKYDAESLIGRSVFSLIAPESHRITQDAVVRRMKGEDVPPYEIRINANDGTYRTVLVHGGLVHFDGGPASINVLTDITPLKEAEAVIRHANEDLEKRVLERTDALRKANEQLTAEIAARALAEQETRRSLEEKVLLLREIHHRVKNNLQIITSLLKLQSRFIDDPHVLEAIKDTQSRVRAMSLVHERIYRSPDIAEISLKEYLTYLIKQVFQFYTIDQQKVGLSVTMPEIMVDIDTVTPLGLIINELVSNSLKYAFPEGRSGTVSLTCTPLEAGRLRFVYHDTGVGMPHGLDWRAAESLGLRLVNSLVDQLDGTVELVNGEGTTFLLEIQKSGTGRAMNEEISDNKGKKE